jgi:hypothetical protein
MRECPGIHRQKAYELSSLPDEVTVVRVGHPLCGQRLRVDWKAGVRRKDRRIVVTLPDGSPTLIPVEWTDAGTIASRSRPARTAKKARLTAGGLRHLIRLVDAMSSKDGDEGASP